MREITCAEVASERSEGRLDEEGESGRCKEAGLCVSTRDLTGVVGGDRTTHSRASELEKPPLRDDGPSRATRSVVHVRT